MRATENTENTENTERLENLESDRVPSLSCNHSNGEFGSRCCFSFSSVFSVANCFFDKPAFFIT